MRIHLISILLFYFSIQITAQEKKANQLYDNLGYLSAAEEYQNMKAEDMTFETKEKLANSFRLNSQFESAEYWYAQIVQEATNPTTLLQYAQMLQSNGKCEDAIRWYQAYQQKSSDTHRSFIEDCAELNNFEQYEHIKISQESILNSDKHDFSPIPFKNGILFTSMRKPEKNASTKTDRWTDGYYSDLYFSEAIGDTYTKPIPLKGAINGEYHDGVACFDPIKDQLLFTRNTPKGKSEEGIKHLSIYAAQEKEGQWVEPTALSFNNKEYSCGHPTLSDDGQRLYFTSNRPNGFGGMDIYVVKRVGNDWGTPQNLGPIVNSSGNEIFPSIAENGKLFFSSDGHKGFGGLDVFVVEKSNDKDEHSWSNRKNIGSPFNSNKDDFGFYMNAEETQGFLSSNRKGNNSGDEIYSWKKTDTSELDPFDPIPVKPIAQSIQPIITPLKVCDIDTKEPIADVKVGIVKAAANWLAYEGTSAIPNSVIKLHPTGEYSIQVAGGTLRADASLLTDPSGSFQYFYQLETTYALFVEANNYVPLYKQYTGWEISQLQDRCLYVNQQACIPLRGKVVDQRLNTPIIAVEVNLINLCNGEIYSRSTNSEGLFEYCLDCTCGYELVFRKDAYEEVRKELTSNQLNCEEKKPMELIIELPITIKPKEEQGLSNTYINQYFTGEEQPTYHEGQVLRLHRIYYDFDKSVIRSDAAFELDYLVALMNQYPSMEIELSAHTDSRGKSDYNGWLSQFRANAAKKYLLNKGIDRNRIHKTKGYGESRLFNHCANGEDCTEEEHQENRRTEVKIVRFEGQAQDLSHQGIDRKFD